jgi:hypothetical protein
MNGSSTPLEPTVLHQTVPGLVYFIFVVVFIVPGTMRYFKNINLGVIGYLTEPTYEDSEHYSCALKRWSMTCQLTFSCCVGALSIYRAIVVLHWA